MKCLSDFYRYNFQAPSLSSVEPCEDILSELVHHFPSAIRVFVASCLEPDFPQTIKATFMSVSRTYF